MKSVIKMIVFLLSPFCFGQTNEVKRQEVPESPVLEIDYNKKVVLDTSSVIIVDLASKIPANETFKKKKLKLVNEFNREREK